MSSEFEVQDFEVVEPLAAVAEPAGQVLHKRQVQFHQGRPDAGPFRVVRRQVRQPLEQLPGPGPVG